MVSLWVLVSPGGWDTPVGDTLGKMSCTGCWRAARRWLQGEHLLLHLYNVCHLLFLLHYVRFVPLGTFGQWNCSKCRKNAWEKEILILMSPGASFAVSRLNCWNCHFMGHVWETYKAQNVTLGNIWKTEHLIPALPRVHCPALHCWDQCCLHSMGPEHRIQALIALHLLSTKSWGILFNTFQIWTQGD